MKSRICRTVLLASAFAMLAPAAAWARQPKKYQVTGTVIEVSKDLIVVQKDDEKFELSRDEATKVAGELKVGAKVTVEYRMSAVGAEVKKDEAKKK